MLIYNDQKDSVTKENEKLYQTLIPEDNFWKKLNKMVDFKAIGELLKDKYETTKGKTEKDTVKTFKLLLLKLYYELSDEDLIEKSQTDLVFKYFLELDFLETSKVDASLLKTFRRERISINDEVIKRLIDMTLSLGKETKHLKI